MRHGIAIERAQGEDAAGRTLSRKGWRKTSRVVRGLKRLCPRLDAIASSPLTRAMQTAQAVDEDIPAPYEVWPELALMLEEDADLAPLVARLQASASICILLVGHEPGCSRLTSLLMCGHADAMTFEWKKAGVACLKLEGERAILQWLASPKMLRALAQKPCL